MAASASSITTNFISTLTQTALGTQRDDSLKDNLRKSWRRRIGGTWLLLTYGVVFYTVIMSLTAYQVQTRVRAISVAGDTQSIWSITRAAEDIHNLDWQLNAKLERLQAKETELRTVEREISDLNQSSWDAYDKVVLLLSQLDPPVRLADDVSTTRFLEEATKAESDPKLGAAIKEQKEAYIKANSDYRKKETIQKSAASEIQRLETQIKTLDQKKLDYVSKLKNPVQTADLIDELRFFRNPLSNLFGTSENSRASYLFVVMPSEVLIMLVVITVGAMGSMISITQTFFLGEDRPITYFIFRPLLGAVVALGVYVLTKAGVLVASNIGARPDGAAELNAFFVAFVSLVAGLMSDAAISTIKRAGTSFLRGDPVTEKDRYAVKVADAMKAKGKKKKQLYAFFNRDKADIDKWMDESEPVPGDAQRVIAAWLEEPVRNLFSDLPPRKKEAEDG